MGTIGKGLSTPASNPGTNASRMLALATGQCVDAEEGMAAATETGDGGSFLWVQWKHLCRLRPARGSAGSIEGSEGYRSDPDAERGRDSASTLETLH